MKPAFPKLGGHGMEYKINDALGAIYMEEEGEFRGPWRRGPKPTLTIVSAHIQTRKTSYTQVFRNYMGLSQ